MKRVFSLISIFIVILITIFSFNRVVIADSGWDSDYDSGGSDWSSSSSSSSSSSWDDDDDWGSSSGHSSGSSNDFFLGMAVAVLLIVVICFLYNGKEIYKDGKICYKFDENSDSEIDLIKKMYPNVDLDTIKDKVYKNFVDVQIAWMNFDYDALSRLCSDELFNEYKNELEVLKLKQQKNIMSNFKLLNFRYKNFNYENNIYTFQVIFAISFYDYVVDSKGKIVRGKKFKKIENAYRLTYSYSDGSNCICPNCGAKVNSNKCEYCGSTIKYVSDDVVLVEKERIR